MMKSVRTSETSVSFYQTMWCSTPENTHVHTCHCENLRCHCGGGGHLNPHALMAALRDKQPQALATLISDEKVPVVSAYENG
jgi:hypothetical protein